MNLVMVINQIKRDSCISLYFIPALGNRLLESVERPARLLFLLSVCFIEIIFNANKHFRCGEAFQPRTVIAIVLTSIF